MKVTLFVDDSIESHQAIERFRKVDVNLSVSYVSGYGLPSVKIGNTIYPGMWGVEFVLYGLEK